MITETFLLTVAGGSGLIPSIHLSVRVVPLVG